MDHKIRKTLAANRNNVSHTARQLGIPRTTLRRLIANKDKNSGAQKSVERTDVQQELDKVDAAIVTCAQEGVERIEPFFDNLKAYAGHLNAVLIVNPFAYGQPAKEPPVPECVFGDTLICTNVPIVPTATTPLTGLETYSAALSAVFTHPRVALRSIPTKERTHHKIIQTTGAITPPQYKNASKATEKAGFHHSLSALLILKNRKTGKTTTRYLHANEKDSYSFCDENNTVKDGKVTENKNVEVMVLGDIHWEQRNKRALRKSLTLAAGLSPKHIVLHDILDFRTCSKHNRHDHHFRYKVYTHPKAFPPVQETIDALAVWLKDLATDFKETNIVVVNSNHDDHLTHWLQTADYREDPQNAETFLAYQLALYKAIREKDKNFNILYWALRRSTDLPDNVKLLTTADSYMVNGVEHGMHGHLGANGARATPVSFTKMGAKTTTGHTHSPQIVDGSYVVGTLSNLDMGYNTGLSSWAQANAIQYINGSRTLVFV